MSIQALRDYVRVIGKSSHWLDALPIYAGNARGHMGGNMVLLELMIFTVGILLLLLFCTQILLPFLRGTRYFPFFRKKTEFDVQVENAEHALEETTELAILEKQLASIQARIDALSKGKK